MKLTYFFFLVSFSLSFVSCDFVSQAYNETFSLEKEEDSTIDSTQSNHSKMDDDLVQSNFDEKITEPTNLLNNKEGLLDIQQKLVEMFPDKSLKIYPPHIYFGKERIRLQLVNPADEGEVDWYFYHAKTGLWEKEDPVKITRHSKREPILLSEVDFGMANNVYLQVKEKTPSIEGAKPISTIYFSFNIPQWNWNTTIYGSRSDYTFRADKSGKEIFFKQR